MNTRHFAAAAMLAPALLLGQLGHHPHLGGPHTLSLSVSPYKVTTSSHHAVRTVTLTNLSGGTVRVTTSFLTFSKAGRDCKAGQPPSWAHVTPTSFKLARGAHIRTTIVLDAPAGTRGAYDLAAVYRAAPDVKRLHHSGAVLSGAVGVRVLDSLGGTTASPCAVAKALRPSPPGMSPLVMGGLALAGVLVLALGVLLVRWTRRHLRWA